MTAPPDSPHIGLVVEGRGELSAVPILLRKELDRLAIYDDVLGKPFPMNGRGNATCEGGIEGAVGAVAARPGCDGVLVILDAEKDPVCPLGPKLQARSSSACGVPVKVCLADSKFESWIVASAESLEIPATFDPSRDSTSTIEAALKPTKYVKTIWQPRLTAKIDLVLAESRNASLARMLDRFRSLVALL